MSSILEYIKFNKIVLIMAMMVVASVFASISFGQYSYFATMGGLSVYCVFKNEKIEGIFVFLLVWIFLGMLLNYVFPIQYLYFVLLITCASPMFSSYRAYVLRTKLLYALCMILPLVTILNLYAYQAGINYYVMIMTLEKVAAYNFSGYLHHPMWLAAVNGMSNVVLLFLFYKQRDSKWIIKGGIIGLLVLSLYLSVVAASRSALASSLLAMGGMVYLQSKTSGKFVRSVFVIGVMAYLLIPFLTNDSESMQRKFESEERGEGSSRDVSWTMRIEEFKESPIYGIGFSTAYKNIGWKVTGTMETGSGWLAILSQTGLVGALIFIGFMKKSFVPISRIKEEGGLLVLFACLFLYLSAHSMFEGYIYTAGYCPCMFFWLTLSFFYEYNKYGYPEEVEDPMVEYEDVDGEDEDDEDYGDDNEDELDSENEDQEEYRSNRFSPQYV